MARRTDLVLDEAVDPREVLASLQVGGGGGVGGGGERGIPCVEAVGTEKKVGQNRKEEK